VSFVCFASTSLSFFSSLKKEIIVKIVGPPLAQPW